MAPQHPQDQVEIPLKTPFASLLHSLPFPVPVFAQAVPSIDNILPIFSQPNLSKLTQLHPKTLELLSHPIHRARVMTPSFKYPHQGLAESRHLALWPEERK